ncbi:MAG: glycosyltransferase [Trueperaceae bacterium]
MPQIPGIAAMPTTIANAVLGAFPERTLAVRGPDRVVALVPMFEEEAGAERCLTALLAQHEPLDGVVVSVNGGRDRTATVVAATLVAHGYAIVDRRRWGPHGASVARWIGASGISVVDVVHHVTPTSKAESLNLAVAGGLVSAERVLVVDGDTVLEPGFVAAIRDGFYRLRRVTGHAGPRWVLEDVALQSGAVTSRRPRGGDGAARFVSTARSAEYAFSVVVRRGQAVRLGRGPTFGASRLFTVVGCGFVARRDAFPMPADGLTEDHDFTVQVQAGPVEERTFDVATLHERGFRVVHGGGLQPLATVVDAPRLTVRKTADARFEVAAAMATEDPPRLSAYLHQVERWVGGALEVVVKRAGTRARRAALPANVQFALLTAQLENLAGLLLLLALPTALGLALPWVGLEGMVRAVATLLLADVAVTGFLVFLGFWTQERTRGGRPWNALRSASRRTAVGILPLLLLRPVNALAYATALTRLLPSFAAWRAPPAARGTSVVWRRPASVPRGARTRTVVVTVALGTVAAGGFAATVWTAGAVDPAARAAYRIVRSAPPVRFDEAMRLPLTSARSPDQDADGASAIGRCDPLVVPAAASESRSLAVGDDRYRPLSPWGQITLARLVPVAHALERAATAYDVPATLLLQVLLNESYLDPLARGPTDDVGLAQVTVDAVRLLRPLADDAASPYANPHLFGDLFNAFDPEFSVCAGAAKLAWSRNQAHDAVDEVVYARYVNPTHGVVGGQVSERHRPLVDAFVRVGPMAAALAATFDAYRRDPGGVAPTERALLQVVDEVAAATHDVEGAYRRVAELAPTLGISDPGFFEGVLAGLYGDAPAFEGLPLAEAR